MKISPETFSVVPNRRADFLDDTGSNIYVRLDVGSCGDGVLLAIKYKARRVAEIAKLQSSEVRWLRDA